MITQASLYAEEASNVHGRCAYCMGQHILLMGVLSVRTPLFLEDENFFQKSARVVVLAIRLNYVYNHASRFLSCIFFKNNCF